MSKRLLGNPRVWDFVAKQAKSENGILRGGWKNSYTGEYFSDEEMKEYADDVYEKLKDYLHNDTVCLEIGCASGLTMYRIAPYCKKYIGTDQANKNLEINKKVNDDSGIANIELIQCRADEIDRKSVGNVDIVIFNSVCQYFDDEQYMLDVFEKCAALIPEEGVIYYGDIRDADLLGEYKKSLYEYKAKDDNRFVSNAIEHAENGSELLFKREFFERLPERYDFVGGVEITKKYGSIRNEMTEYRYDVVVHISKLK